jgi:hypothetical protein
LVQAQVLAPATFTEDTGPGGSHPGNAGCIGLFGSAEGVDDGAPESASFSDSGPDAFFSGTATTLLAGPTAEVTASGQGCSFARAGSAAGVGYEFTVVAMVPGAPMGLVIPILVTTEGSAAVSGLGMRGEAIFRLLGGIGVQFNAVAGDGPSLPPSDSFSETFTEEVAVADIRTVGLAAVCDVSDGSCSAEVDPLIEIDPTFLVDFEGSPTPATDLYELRFSSPVPEPASFWLQLVALASLASLRPRRRTPNRCEGRNRGLATDVQRGSASFEPSESHAVRVRLEDFIYELCWKAVLLRWWCVAARELSRRITTCEVLREEFGR